MIVDLPYSYHVPALPPRARNPRPLWLTECVTVDIPDVASSDLDLVATITTNTRSGQSMRVLHDGERFLRHVKGPMNGAEVDKGLFTRILSGKAENGWTFSDYGLPVEKSGSGNPSFANPLLAVDVQIVGDEDGAKRNRARANAISKANAFVFVDGILFCKTREPAITIDLTYVHKGEAGQCTVDFARDRSARSEKNEFLLSLRDIVDPRFGEWFYPLADADFHVDLHRPDLVDVFDPLAFNAPIIGSNVLASVHGQSPHSMTDEMIELSIQTSQVALAFRQIRGGGDANEAVEAYRALPDDVRDRCLHVDRMIRYLVESGWMERSRSQTKTVDLDALASVSTFPRR